MGEKVLELKLMYCKDLKSFNFFQKLNVYALVSILDDKDKKKLQEQRTPTDTEGDANPEWNHQIKFDLSSVQYLNDDCLFIHFDLHSEANSIILAIGGDKRIGHVRVPLKDLVQSPNVARFVNYEVRSVDGKSNGVINFSYKFVSNFKQQEEWPTTLPNVNVTGYPIHHPNPSNLYSPPPPSSEIQYQSINMETDSPHSYYNSVSTPMTPYSPQHGYVHQHQHQHQHQHPFSPLRPSAPVAYPPQFVESPPPQPQLPPYTYPPPPQHQQLEYHQEVFSPNWAQYPPHPSDPLFGVANGSDYFHSPGSPGTPISNQTTAWPGHYPPGGDHFSPPWNNRPHL